MLSIQELPRIIRFLPKILLAIIVTACDELYKKIAYWLNDMGVLGMAPRGAVGKAGCWDPLP